MNSKMFYILHTTIQKFGVDKVSPRMHLIKKKEKKQY